MNSCTKYLLTATILLASESTLATNANFQAFFFDVCGNPTGQLAARCAETDNGLGDLSGDSESSLNPSQTLGSLAGNRNSAEQRNNVGQPAGQPGDGLTETIKLDVGPTSLLVNARFSNEALDRKVDADRSRGYELDNYGLQLGLDYRLSDSLVIGALALWERGQLAFDRENAGRNFAPIGDAGRVETDSLGLALFASREWDNGVYANLTVSYLGNQFDFERRAVFQESNRAVATTYVATNASGDGRSLSASTSLERTLNAGRWTLSPYIGLNYQNLAVDGYTERDLSNSGLALQVRGQRSKRLDALLGFRTSAVFSNNRFVWIPHMRLQATYSFNAQRQDAEVVFTQDVSQQAFQLRGDSPDTSFWEIGLGSSMVFTNGLSAFVEVQTTLGRKDFDAYSLNAGIRVEL